MSLFEGASEIVIIGGEFTSVHQGQRTDSEQALRKLVEKDSAFNGYSPSNHTLKLPLFSKDLILNIVEKDLDTGRMASGSCCFDLAWRLGLLPGQPNEALAEYDEHLPLNEVVSRNACCCGRISRHGFIFLVSQYFQHATTTEIPGFGRCIVLSTSIGKFKCYEINDCTFVHFDGGTRSSHIDLVKNQNLDQILRLSRGQYLLMEDKLKKFSWQNCSETLQVEAFSTGNFFGLPDAVMYMTKEALIRWKELNQYSKALVDAVLRFIDEIKEPQSFVTAIRDQLSPERVRFDTPAQKLASCVYLCGVLSKKDSNAISFEFIHDYARQNMVDLVEAHQHYRSPLAESEKLFKTSKGRFLRLLREYHYQDNQVRGQNDASIRRELQTLLLSNKNNVALVVFQGFLSIIAIWNSSRVLSRAREVPEEWIRFVSAEDDYIYLG